jgi:hypothetical protein
VVAGGIGRELRAVLAWRIEAEERLASQPRASFFPGWRGFREGNGSAWRLVGLARDPESARFAWRRAGEGPERVFDAAELAEWGQAFCESRPGRILVAGSTWSSYLEARRSGFGFIPVIPGAEDASWEALARESLPIPGSLAAFLAALPPAPPWLRRGRRSF